MIDKENEIKVSIVIPVYNGEAFIREALDSLVNQTYNNIEIVIVDDNSPDNSYLIEDEYKKNYPDIINIIRLEENGGVSHAFNVGIDNANGEYVCLLGQDDWLDYDCIEKMVNKVDDKVDAIVIPKANWFNNRVVSVSELSEEYLGEMNYEKRKQALVEFADVNGFVFFGMIRKKLINDNSLRRPDGVTPDDVSFNPFIILYSNVIIFIDNTFYNYRIHESSTAHKKNHSFYLELYKAGLIMRDEFVNRGLYSAYEKEVDFMFVLSFYYHTVFNSLARYDIRPIDHMTMVRDKMKEILPNYQDNYYVNNRMSKWKRELLRLNDISPKELVSRFPDADDFLNMVRNGEIEKILL